MPDLRAILRSDAVLVCDGAMGTFLQQRGLAPGACPELWCVERPDAVRDIHLAYREAGSQIVECNSFGGSRIKLDDHGLADRTVELNRAAAALACEVAGEQQLVLGSMGPTGEFMEPLGEVTEEEMVDVFREQAGALAEGGADAVIIETMTAKEEALAALRAVREFPGLVPVVSFTFDPLATGGYATMMGLRPADAARAARDAGAEVVGANCGLGPADMTAILREMRDAVPGFPLLAMPNAGMPQLRDGETVYLETPAQMAAQVPDLLEAGARILGGCCGTGPAHIAALLAAVPAARRWTP